MDKKSKFGNITLKVDIAKAFDTIKWEFILKVLNRFGLCPNFCNWIHNILDSNLISINFNGESHGYFKFSREVRQGDPPSPILFCLAEEVLSRLISAAVSNGNIFLINASRNNHVPFHIMYAEDILIFYYAKTSNVKNLRDVFRHTLQPPVK